MFTMRVLRLLCLVLVLTNSSLAQCPWHKDVPDLQTACLCAYNLGHELSVQCDQVRIRCVSMCVYRPNNVTTQSSNRCVITSRAFNDILFISHFSSFLFVLFLSHLVWFRCEFRLTFHCYWKH